MDFLRYPIREIKLHSEGISVKTSLPVDFLSQTFVDSEVDSSKSSADVALKLTYIPGGQIQARGQVQGILALSCQRCLEPVSFSFSGPLHAYFLPPGANLPGRETEGESFLDLEAAEYANYEGDFLDLAPYVREQLLLSIPLTILCKEECQGLCTICGENQNLTSCSCQETVSFSPFAKLKNLPLSS